MPGPLAGTHAHEVMSMTAQLLAAYDNAAGQWDVAANDAAQVGPLSPEIPQC